ncbi:MAG: histidine--tRNA ligase [Candidatus Bipolaricaulota bacterium]|nr:MAG: histidine--tRNA ligase [Candidatus Bipolaricaulota bacterium]
MSVGRVRGTHDILPEEIGRWRLIERTFRGIACRYNYREIRFPVLEHTELFTRGIGEATEVVQKEMYTFNDRKGRSLTLRPEGTASVVRAYVEHGLQTVEPFQKLYYLGPMFRYEKPQKGRQRQFHQYGVEAIGSLDPTLDVEVIDLAWALMAELGLGGLWLRLNSIGCAQDRARYHDVLREHFAGALDSMCDDCRRRFEENPLRILDCKQEQCQPQIASAPGSADHLCDACAEHFAEVRRLLDALGLSYELDPRLVRGLDYYTRTVFELLSKDLGAQDSLLGGGRYDDLVEALGGPSIPAVGFAGGTERLALVAEEHGRGDPADHGIDLFLATIGDDGLDLGMRLAKELRSHGLSVDLDHRGRALRKQMERANRLSAAHLLVLGDDEATSGRGKIKRMETGVETEVEISSAALTTYIRDAE